MPIVHEQQRFSAYLDGEHKPKALPPFPIFQQQCRDPGIGSKVSDS